MKKQKSTEFILIESLLVYIQKNLGRIERFIGELKNCDDLEEQRYKIFQFMNDCFNENIERHPAGNRKLKQFLRETNAKRYMQSIENQLAKQPIEKTIEEMAQVIADSTIEDNRKKNYLERLSKFNTKLLETAYQTAKVEITGMDLKYIICFVADMYIKDICLIFNIEEASVRTVRYRIRKKFVKEDTFRALL